MCFGSSKHVCVPTNHAPVVAGAVICGVAGYQAYLNTIGSETTGRAWNICQISNIISTLYFFNKL